MSDDKPNYNDTRVEKYLNFLVGSSNTFPQSPRCRKEEYLDYLCRHGGGGGGDTFWGNIRGLLENQEDLSNALASKEAKKPYSSLLRERSYLCTVTFNDIPEDSGLDTFQSGGCSSYIKDGKLYRNLDWEYSEVTAFHVKCKNFEGNAFINDITDDSMSDDLIGQLPYHIADGRNNNGIMISTHVLFNDWSWRGTEGGTPLWKVPYLILSNIKTLENFATQINDLLEDVYATPSMVARDMLLQFLVSDGVNTYIITPPTNSSDPYTVINATSNPKLTNFRWVSDKNVIRTNLQERPVGVERWNLIPCDLKNLRYTKAYESPIWLSEFIGINGTTKDSTDEELSEIYEEAHNRYLSRTRNGETWQTLWSVVYSSENGLECLNVQEDFNISYSNSSQDNNNTEILELQGSELPRVGFQMTVSGLDVQKFTSAIDGNKNIIFYLHSSIEETPMTFTLNTDLTAKVDSIYVCMASAIYDGNLIKLSIQVEDDEPSLYCLYCTIGGNVSSVNGKIGEVVLDAEDIRLTSSQQTVEEKLNQIDGSIDDIPIVSVSSTGTATDEVKFITIDGVEKKLPTGGGSQDLSLGFRGKVISILGDSISTFEGYNPISDGHNLTHRIRYNHANASWFFNEGGTVDDTYWKHLINTLGAKLGVNDSWAGSRVSNSSTADSGDVGPKACMAGMTRIQNLGSNGTPDLILYFGGTNDAGAGVAVGSFDSTRTYSLDTSTEVWSDFATAYKDSIMRLQYLYPFAKIVVLLPMYCSTYYTMGNLDKYNEQIKLICDYFGVEYIDFRRCGINQQNLTTMLGDGIHPKKAGFELMYRYLYNKLSSMYSSDNVENVVYNVTNNLLINTNTDRYIKGVSKGKSYNATITGSALTAVHVLMNGVDVTSTSYNASTGKISISAATGNIVITEDNVTVYTITTNITNGTYIGDTSILEGGTANITATANGGYRLPSTITVVGADYTYHSSTGVISLSNATSNITITIACEVIPIYDISVNVTNGTYVGDETIVESGTATVTVSAGIGYRLPNSITVIGARYTYDKNTGIINLSDATDDVSILVICEEYIATVYEITTTVTNGTYTGATQIQENGTATVTITADGSYSLPDSITVSGANYTYDNNTGIIDLSNPTSDVSIVANCTEIVVYSIITNVTNGTYSGDTSVTNIGTATVTVTANEGYALPNTVTVIGADYTYDSTSGIISISNAVSDVEIVAVCDVGAYSKIEYIYSDKNVATASTPAVQYIATGIDYMSGDIVEIVAQGDNYNATQVVSNKGAPEGGSWLGINNTWAVGGSGYQSTYSKTTKITAEIVYTDEGVVANVSDGVTTETVSRAISQQSGSLKYLLFAMESGSGSMVYAFRGKLYSAKIKRNGEYIAIYEPAIRNADEKVGLHETITDTFLTSGGSEEFVAGPII